jgi:NADP-dependent 3-hydroxy acid dehydrogenase YdfG
VSELREHISEEDVAQSVTGLVSEIAMPRDSFARMVAFAISQPEEVDVNEILFRSTRQLSNVNLREFRLSPVNVAVVFE